MQEQIKEELSKKWVGRTQKHLHVSAGALQNKNYRDLTERA